MGGVRWRSSTMVIPQRSSQTDDQKADAAGQIVGVSESYKYDGEESRVHFELRSERSRMYQLQSIIIHGLLVLLIGVVLAIVAAMLVYLENHLVSVKMHIIKTVLWPCDPDCSDDAQPNSWGAYGAYVSYSLSLILVAALLTLWVPEAKGSGLPQLKAFLNGVKVKDLFRPQTFVAKFFGTLCVVSTNLPLGKEGPMVHIRRGGGAVLRC